MKRLRKVIARLLAMKQKTGIAILIGILYLVLWGTNASAWYNENVADWAENNFYNGQTWFDGMNSIGQCATFVAHVIRSSTGINPGYGYYPGQYHIPLNKIAQEVSWPNVKRGYIVSSNSHIAIVSGVRNGHLYITDANSDELGTIYLNHSGHWMSSHNWRFWKLGNDRPQVLPPTITTAQTSLVGSDSVQFSASVNPNGASARVEFEWGPSPAYGQKSPAQSIGNGRSVRSVSAIVMELKPKTTYYYRLKASNSQGTRYYTGHFTTLPPMLLSATPSLQAVNPGHENFVRLRVFTLRPSQGDYYRIYRSTKPDWRTASPLSGWLRNPSPSSFRPVEYEDRTAQPGIVYYYWNRYARNSNGDSATGYSDTRYIADTDEYANAGFLARRVATSTINASQNLSEKITLSWDAVPGATYYRVYHSRRTDCDLCITTAEYTPLGDWQQATVFDDDSAAFNTSYTYSVRYLRASNSPGQGTGIPFGSARGKRAVSVKASDGAYVDKVTVRWSNMGKLYSYRVYALDQTSGQETPLGPWQQDALFEDSGSETNVSHNYRVYYTAETNPAEEKQGILLGSDSGYRAAQDFQVIGLEPQPGKILQTSPGSISVSFNNQVNENTLSESTVALLGSGGDRSFAEGNEFEVTPTAIRLLSPTTIEYDLSGQTLPNDSYRLVLKGGANNNDRRDFSTEARNIAFDSDESLIRVPGTLAAEIENDVHNIRQQYPAMHYIMNYWNVSWSPKNQLHISLTPEAQELYKQGNYHGLDELNSQYGPVTVDEYIYNPRLNFYNRFPQCETYAHWPASTKEKIARILSSGEPSIYRKYYSPYEVCQKIPPDRSSLSLRLTFDYELYQTLRLAELYNNINGVTSAFVDTVMSSSSYKSGQFYRAQIRRLASETYQLTGEWYTKTESQSFVERAHSWTFTVRNGIATLIREEGDQLAEGLLEESLRDLAGHRLDGEYQKSFPSGNGMYGGDFIALFSVDSDAQNIVTPEGGTVSLSEQSASADFSAGATTQDMYVSIEIVDPLQTPPAKGGFEVLGHVYEFTAMLASGEPVTEFSADVRLSLPYNPDEFGGIDERELKMHYYDEVLGEWIALASEVDLVNHVVTATTTHFTKFAILAPILIQATPIPAKIPEYPTPEVPAGVPEPTTFLLVAIGLLGIRATLRKKRMER